MDDGAHRMSLGVRVLDKRRGRERVVHEIQPLGRVVKLLLKDPQTGEIEQAIYTRAEVASRFEVLLAGTGAFNADSTLVGLVAECHRLQHAYLFNPVFATGTSLIDILPHQLIAVYGMPVDGGAGQRGSLTIRGSAFSSPTMPELARRS